MMQGVTRRGGNNEGHHRLKWSIISIAKSSEGKMESLTGSEIITLRVGQKFHLKTGKDNIYYAGMPSERVYSIVQVKSNGYQGYAWNLFFDHKQTEISIDGVPLYIIRATPTALEFRITR